ncbi:CXA4 protein, partial [Neodrepanis coruscans]|nr:CXA4 protein [Neodrepanis coruscans]
SHIRYWVLQFLFVSTPTLIYLGHVVYLSRREEKLKQRESELRASHSKDPKTEHALAAVERKIAKISVTEDGRLKIRGALMWTYITSVICKSIFEAGFLVGQWYLYGFSMVPRYVCKRDPCPHQVDCFISRPTEKSIFIIFMLVMGLISLILNLLELFHLCCKNLLSNIKKVPEPVVPNQDVFVDGMASHPYAPKHYPFLPMAESHVPSYQTYNKLSSEQNWANFHNEENLALGRASRPLSDPYTHQAAEASAPEEKLSSWNGSSASKKQYV